jgi:hypothetical protein
LHFATVATGVRPVEASEKLVARYARNATRQIF